MRKVAFLLLFLCSCATVKKNEKRMDSKRLNMKMVLPEDYDLEVQMEFFKEKIKEKYNTITELF
jgi:hypothetical protein